MFKKCLILVFSLGACAVTPLTPQETQIGVAHRIGAQACYQKGWVSNPPVMAAYLSAVQGRLASRGNPSQIAQAERTVGPYISRLTIQDCRDLELQALQYASTQASQQQTYTPAYSPPAIQPPVINIPAPQVTPLTLPGSNTVRCTTIGINTICR